MHVYVPSDTSIWHQLFAVFGKGSLREEKMEISRCYVLIRGVEACSCNLNTRSYTSPGCVLASVLWGNHWSWWTMCQTHLDSCLSYPPPTQSLCTVAGGGCGWRLVEQDAETCDFPKYREVGVPSSAAAHTPASGCKTHFMQYISCLYTVYACIYTVYMCMYVLRTLAPPSSWTVFDSSIVIFVIFM